MNKKTPIAPTEATLIEFLDTAAVLERRFDRALSNTRGVSFSEYRLLKTLSTAGGSGLARIDLAEAIGLTASAVTRALKPLEKLGYVTAERSERDARQSLAVITKAGLALLADAQDVSHDMLQALSLHSLKPNQLTEFKTRLSELRNKG